MPHEKYRVTLTEPEKDQLHDIIDRGKHGAQKRKRAQALLLADEEYTDEITADRSGMHRRVLEQPQLCLDKYSKKIYIRNVV
jgi:hypothetical protein